MSSVGIIPVEFSPLIIHAYFFHLSSFSHIRSVNSSGIKQHDSQPYQINLAKAVYPSYLYVTQNKHRTS